MLFFNKILCVAAVLCGAGLSLGNAQAQTVLTELDGCLEKAASSQQMAACAVKAYKLADQELNSLYQALLPTLLPAQKKNLVQAQGIWLKFRDSYCSQFLAASLPAGPEKQFVQQRCMAQLSHERSQHFSELLVSP